jgi:hypothetical protein
VYTCTPSTNPDHHNTRSTSPGTCQATSPSQSRLLHTLIIHLVSMHLRNVRHHLILTRKSAIARPFATTTVGHRTEEDSLLWSMSSVVVTMEVRPASESFVVAVKKCAAEDEIAWVVRGLYGADIRGRMRNSRECFLRCVRSKMCGGIC